MKRFSMNKSKISQLISTHIPFTKNISNLKPDFLTIIKTSIPSITKHRKNVCVLFVTPINT